MRSAVPWWTGTGIHGPDRGHVRGYGGPLPVPYTPHRGVPYTMSLSITNTSMREADTSIPVPTYMVLPNTYGV